ncbi:MAG: hypothetical protein AAGE84_21780 [Cyanobacteria bacterium P01_G01_bin.39]
MNATSPRNSKVPNWSTIIMFALGFWLSGSLVFDFLVVPGMLTSGMMNESGFASAGYMIFGTFNHVELLCAAIVLAGCFVYRYGYGLNAQINTQSLLTASILLIIALAYTYILTPQMSSLGMSLDLFSAPQSNPAAMKIMHLAYWGLEAVKLVAATALLRIFYSNSCAIG